MKNKAFNNALRIAVYYLLIGAIWIVLSDRLVDLLSNDPNTITNLQTYKGWSFVIVTSVLLFILLQRYFLNLENERFNLDSVKNNLYEVEKIYKLMFENSGEAILLTQADGSIFDANPEACRTFGRTVEEIRTVGRNGLVDLNDPRLVPAIDERHKTGNFKGELNFIRKDGTIFPAEISSTIFKDSAGEERTSMFIKDIIQRKQTEKALLDSEERFRRLAENAQDMIYRMSLPDGKYEYVSPAANEIFGYSPGEFYSAPKLIQQTIHPDWNAYFQEQWTNLIKGIMPPTYEYQIINKSGKIHWLNQRNILVRNEIGNPIAIEGIVTDITERKLAEEALRESEEKYRTFVELSPDAVIIHTDGIIQFVNAASIKLFDAKSKNALIGKNIIDLVHSDYKNIVEERIIKITVEQTPVPITEEKLVALSGRIFDAEVSAVPIDLKGNKSVQVVARDITVRKNDELKIRENEEIFNQFMTHSPVYIFFKDENMRPLRLSRNFEKMLNKPLKDILSKNMFELFPSDISKAMVENDKKILYSGELVKEDEKIDDRYYTTIKFPIFIEGTPRYLAGFTIDITDRMLIEEVLHESNEFLESLFNSANAPIVVWNDQFTITRFNPAFERLTGRTAKKVIGQSLEILFPPENIESSMKLMRKAQAGEQLENVEIDFLHFDGSIRIVLWNSASVLGIDGKSIATIAQGLDITERKEIEEALRKSRKEFQTYFDSNSVGLSVTSVDNTWIEVNQKLCDIFGYTKAELVQYNWLNLTHPEDLSDNLKLFNQTLDGEIDNYSLEKRFFRKDGSIIYVSISAVCQRNADGSVHHFLTSYNDITERKLAEDAILNSEIKLRSLNARLENVREEERINLSRELHDHLGQNLTGLKMEISYFANKMRTNQAFDTLDFLSKAPGIIALIDEMINNVRKISAELRPNVLDYLGLIPAIEWQIDELKKRTPIDCVLKSEVAKIDLGVQVNSSIFRIVQEAFTNIIRHSGATQVMVSIKAENDQIKLEILDNGKGIKKADILALHSLGIIGMKERTLQFNGKLYLDNGPQGGTLLTLIIPNAED